ncbi:FUSC family protein [Caldalkalibacillus mannanilyticus]|uniref:FUSC family protein n=1 Tax=Caldalkalibacillus mannanilyticus TaxID=1418 RepID=UPI000469942E|nr:aromatic acid exporter family protein [Caldalkalibacillus mannanilyticus]
MKFGARILKTGIALTIALYLATFFGLDPVIFAALAAALSIQPSLYRSWQHILDQIQANIIGALVAISFTYLLGNEPFIVGIVVMLVIAINLQLKFEKAIPLSIITVIAIMESTTGSFLLFAADRFLLILTGIGAALLVNVIFLPPKYEEKLYQKILGTNRMILEYLRSSTMNELEDKKYREDLKLMNQQFEQLDDLYCLYKEERTYFRKVQYSKARKLVLYRQMIKSSKKAFYLLERSERQQNDLQTLSEDLRELLHREIEMLTNYHEKILLKYEGKIKTQHPHQPSNDIIQGREGLLHSFVLLYDDENEARRSQWLHLFPVLSRVIDYSEDLDHLDKLVENYYSFH